MAIPFRPTPSLAPIAPAGDPTGRTGYHRIMPPEATTPSFNSLYTHGFARVSVCVPNVKVAAPAFNAERTLALAPRGGGGRGGAGAVPGAGDLRLLQRRPVPPGRAARRHRGVPWRHVVDGAATLRRCCWSARRCGSRASSSTARSSSTAAGCSASSRRPTCPNYREFYEKRQFTAGTSAMSRGGTVRLLGQRCALRRTTWSSRRPTCPGFALHVEICEDVWTPIPPCTYGALAGATVLANLSASNITIGKAEYRRDLCAVAVRQVHRRVPLLRRRAGRVDDRPGVGRPRADLRERQRCWPSPSASPTASSGSPPTSTWSACARSGCG